MTHWYLTVLLIVTATIAVFGFSYMQLATPHLLPTQFNAATSSRGSAATRSTTTTQGQPADQDSSSTVDWKTYENSEFGFTIKYPSTFAFSENNIKNTDSFKGAVIVQFGPPRPLPYAERDTNAPTLAVAVLRTNKASCSDMGTFVQADGISATGTLTRVNGMTALRVTVDTVRPGEMGDRGLTYYFCPRKVQQQDFIYRLQAWEGGEPSSPDIYEIFEAMVGTFIFTQ
jgi:hypothetical protein